MSVPNLDHGPPPLGFSGMRDAAIHSFPVAVINPGKTCRVAVKATYGAFDPRKLCMAGLMDEARGHFKIRHTRLPAAESRECDRLQQRLARVPSRRRTTIEYRERPTGNFVRSYLPSNVVYSSIDPLSTIVSPRYDRRPPARVPVSRLCALLFPGLLRHRHPHGADAVNPSCWC